MLTTDTRLLDAQRGTFCSCLMFPIFEQVGSEITSFGRGWLMLPRREVKTSYSMLLDAHEEEILMLCDVSLNIAGDGIPPLAANGGGMGVVDIDKE